MSPESPTLSAAVGGTYAEVYAGGFSGTSLVGGGRRGKISEFSPASRRRLLVLLNSIDQRKMPLPVFITLTYPGSWPTDSRERKRHLDAFRKRMERRLGRFPAIWRLEFQRRGAPHYHLLAFVDDGVSCLRTFVSEAWYESCGRICPEHLRAGTNVQRVRSWRQASSYAAKYLGKLETLAPGCPSPGRFWGVWRRNLLPIYFENTRVTLPDFFRLRRVFRRYGRLRIRNTREHRRVGCFVSHSSSRRLLAWLGIIGTSQPRSSYSSWRRSVVGSGSRASAS